MRVFASCTPGLEPALAAELKALGYRAKQVSGGCETSGDFELLNLWSRIASRITVDGKDSSGDLLYLRGYREEIGRAPMRETLAAGVLGLAGYDGTERLWDPMCGSGTLLIEAALMAKGLAPGANRKFAFQTWPGHDAKRFAALPRAMPRQAPPLTGTDLNAGALGVTRRNAKRAGVLEALKLERADAAKVKPEGAPGLLVANFPYGKRVERGDLGAVVANLAAQFTGWRYAFLVEGNTFGLKAEHVHAVANGGIRCKLVVGRF